jgi:predicted ABC-type ATPase
MGKQKRLRIFAGPNGSGKSSLYLDFSKESKFTIGYFLNADLIEKQLLEKGFVNLSDFNIEASEKDFLKFSKNSKLKKKAQKEGFKIDIQFKENFLVNLPKETNSYEAAFVSEFLRQELIKLGKTFSFETVMSHESKIEEIINANKEGYKTYLYYICTESSLINKDRVDARVEKGGHYVDDSKIESRFYKSLDLLYNAIRVVHRAYIFDNSGKEYKLIAEFYRGESVKYYTKSFPKWFHQNVIQKLDF